MTPPVLCILQMRSKSSRLERKMLLTLGGETLAARGWRLACEAFGADHCVVAISANDLTMFGELVRIGAHIFEYEGNENDLLGRYHACAHRYRWHGDSVIFRWTADDIFKDPEACRRVANGERLPVEVGGEAFTLAQLDAAQQHIPAPWSTLSGRVIVPEEREHLTFAIPSLNNPPPAPPGCWTIDTDDDYIAALARIEEIADGFERASWDEERGAVS